LQERTTRDFFLKGLYGPLRNGWFPARRSVRSEAVGDQHVDSVTSKCAANDLEFAATAGNADTSTNLAKLCPLDRHQPLIEAGAHRIAVTVEETRADITDGTMPGQIRTRVNSQWKIPANWSGSLGADRAAEAN